MEVTMPGNGITATVKELPPCDLCKETGGNSAARYDAKTQFGPWAYMCEAHFKLDGIGLGTGLGQRLVVA
jgi:hypothetical protein